MPVIMEHMTTVTIPKKLAQKGDLVVIPRKEYEALLEFKKAREFVPTMRERRTLASAEKHLREGKTLSYHAVTRELGLTR